MPGADGGGVGEVAAQGDRLLAGGDRVVEPVGEVQLDRERLEQVGLPCGVGHVGQGELVERDGLPVRARPRRLPGGLGRVAQDPSDVVRGDRVVGEHARVAADPLERGDHRGVQGRLGAERDRAQHRRPGDLVTERHAAAARVEQSGGRERPDRLRREVEGPEQRAADALGGAGEQLDAVPLLGREAGRSGDHRVADALGQRRVGLVEDLTDEERVARRAPVHVGGVELVAFEQLGDGGPGSAA